MTRRPGDHLGAVRALTAALTLFIAGAAGASPRALTLSDPLGDAAPRPTDSGGAGVFNNDVPDLLSVRIAGWESFSPTTDPYNGHEEPASEAHLFRLRLTFDGLVNPPGPLGLSMGPFNPTQFGDRPLYGVLELDVDEHANSGGELEAVAVSRFLANVARFGGLPGGSFGERAAQSADDYDGNYFSQPQFERSGAEFSLIMCGCFQPAIVSEDGDMDGVFDAGETWVVEGRFFERMQAIRQWSGVGGGSDLGLYDPVVRLRFKHDTGVDQTTVTLVYPLDMRGAADLAGEPQQLSDYDVSNHNSIEEAIDDLIETAEGAGGPIQNPAVENMIEQWEGENTQDFLDPADWDMHALFGTAYTSPAASLYVWSDVGFDVTRGDFTTDTLLDNADRSALINEITSRDGTASDADGVVNGVVVIPDHAANFSLYDLDADGVLGQADIDLFDELTPLYGDLNGDCVVDTADLGILLGQFGAAGSADINNDGVVDTADLGILLGMFGGVCG
ncbi:MAG: hypothetical protein H6813_05280 [Phycisphaeraceae bacterium]|nr:hypothetical protein [Phycisphaeraceae bacterium]MCB9847796.1 hypothetical protein [Phycisphaeraceae bacterium]